MPFRLPGGRTTHDLAVRELAVDPADVDRERYPVWIRLTRPLSTHEVSALGSVAPGIDVEDDGLRVNEANLDDIAHEIAEWNSRLERVERLGEELQGEEQRQRQDLDATLRDGGSRSHDRTGEVGMH